jgi:hypothetical protein
VVHEVRRRPGPLIGGVVPDQQQVWGRPHQIGAQAGETVDDLIIEAEQPVMAEIALLGGMGDAGHQFEGMAEAPLPAGAGGGDPFADEILRGEGQYQVDLRVPFQHGLDKQQFGPGARRAVTDVGPQPVEVFLDGVLDRVLAGGRKNGRGRPGEVEGVPAPDQNYGRAHQFQQRGGNGEISFLERKKAIADLQDPGVMHPFIAQRLAELVLGQGRVICQQSAFGLISEGEKPVFRVEPLPRVLGGGEHLARQGPRQFRLAQQPGQAGRMHPVTGLAMSLEGP